MEKVLPVIDLSAVNPRLPVRAPDGEFAFSRRVEGYSEGGQGEDR